MQSSIRYVSVVTKEGGRFILRVISQNDKFIIGTEVNKDGDEVSGSGFDVRQRIVEIGAIKKISEMRMSLMYAKLEKAQP